MALQNVHGKEMSLVLSSDAKPRLKWTPELHQRFIDAVNQLGGPEKATPKSLMRVMGISGLTLYHLKSHLQKYRLGRSQQSQTYQQNKRVDSDNGEHQRNNFTNKNCDGGEKQINESLEVAHALQMQMDVQRKIHEQIEVQRHLQLRIEAQGKYLQSVLKKAQETLSGYSSCSIEVERAKAELTQLMSMVDSGCPSSSFSVLTESDGSMLKDGGNKLLGHNGYSLESSLTSSESSGCKEETQPKNEVDDSHQHGNGKTNKGKGNTTLSLMEMLPVEKNESEIQESKRKRSERTVDEVNRTEESSRDKFRSMEKNIDLNCKSLESSQTSPESSGCKEETQPKNEVDDVHQHGNGKTNKGKRNTTLSLIEMLPVENNEPEIRVIKRKRSERTVDEVNHAKQSSWDKFRSMENIDLNCKSLNEFDSGPKVIDLNFNGFDLFNETFSA